MAMLDQNMPQDIKEEGRQSVDLMFAVASSCIGTVNERELEQTIGLYKL